MNYDELHKELSDWEVLIGKFIIACGSIEKCTYELLQLLPTEDLSRLVLGLGLSNRIDLICDLLPQRIGDERLVDELCDKLNQVKNKIWLRNTIAHNPVDLSLYVDGTIVNSKQVVSKFHYDIDKMRNSEVDILKMMEQYTDMEFLASDIYQLQLKAEELLLTNT